MATPSAALGAGTPELPGHPSLDLLVDLVRRRTDRVHDRRGDLVPEGSAVNRQQNVAVRYFVIPRLEVHVLDLPQRRRKASNQKPLVVRHETPGRNQVKQEGRPKTRNTGKQKKREKYRQQATAWHTAQAGPWSAGVAGSYLLIQFLGGCPRWQTQRFRQRPDDVLHLGNLWDRIGKARPKQTYQ